MANTDLLRQLPGIESLLTAPEVDNLIKRYGRSLTTSALRETVDSARRGILSGLSTAPTHSVIIEETSHRLDSWLNTLRPVINATGVIIHTNLGRSPLSETAIRAMTAAAEGYSTLEYDLEAGQRGSRHTHTEALLTHLLGAEAAMVVNNNAAATMLTLAALAGPDKDQPEGWKVLISRGQLVEIGGGFRMPQVMQTSGARMVEVGTTNRTRLSDYESAVDPAARLIIRVHHSNYQILGFVEEPGISDLARLAQGHKLYLVDDIGSGALLDTSRFGLQPEPMPQDSLRDGSDVVMFSGDKLLGGPQAGIIVGKKTVIDLIKRHPLARAVRADKIALAGLGATLLHYLKDEALEQIPIWSMIAVSKEDLTVKAAAWRDTLKNAGISADLWDGESTVGGGSLPGSALPTCLLAFDLPSPDRALQTLRNGAVPVIARIERDRLVIDPRTILPGQEETLLHALLTLA